MRRHTAPTPPPGPPIQPCFPLEPLFLTLPYYSGTAQTFNVWSSAADLAHFQVDGIANPTLTVYKGVAGSPTPSQGPSCFFPNMECRAKGSFPLGGGATCNKENHTTLPSFAHGDTPWRIADPTTTYHFSVNSYLAFALLSDANAQGFRVHIPSRRGALFLLVQGGG